MDKKNILSVDFIRKATKAELVDPDRQMNSSGRSFGGVGTDTRVDLQGKLFFALKGDKFDAHLFLKQAVDNGATGLVLQKDFSYPYELKDKASIFLVEDTLLAFQDLAREFRRALGFKVLGIAGSNGKTSTKEFVRALVQETFRTHAAKGSFNNHWGVPITLLGAHDDTQAVVVEMGMNHAGELALLTKIAEPDVAVVTYVGVEHIEHFGSLEKIAQAEEEIYSNSPERAALIFNMDNEHTSNMYFKYRKLRPHAQILQFSHRNKNVDVCLAANINDLFSIQVSGHIGGVVGNCKVSIFGLHNVDNLMAAATVALAAGMRPQEIWQALPNCQTIWGRNQVVNTAQGFVILFDGYNANPDSMGALLTNLDHLPWSKGKYAIFGDMLELGDFSAQAHRELGGKAAGAGFSGVYFVGPHAAEFSAGYTAACESGKIKNNLLFSDAYEESLASKIRAMVEPGDLVVVKGSRGIKLEQFVLGSAPLNFAVK